MQKERSSGAIIYKEEEQDKREYLTLLYPGGYWDLPKGHIEEGEDPKETTIREVREETGIDDLKFSQEFEDKIDYTFKRKKEIVYKKVYFYLAKTNQKTVKISHEHKGYQWLPYKETMEKLTYPNAKNMLKKAEEHLNQR